MVKNKSADDEDEDKFPVTSIEKSDPPDGVTDGEWYEYVIGSGSSEIRGKRSGSLRSVRAYVKEYAENLNQRSTLGYSSYATRKTNATKTTATKTTTTK